MADEKKELGQFSEAVDKIVANGAGLEQVAEAIADELGKLVDMDWASIGLIDKGEGKVRLVPLATKVKWQLDTDSILYLSGSPVEWVVKNKCGMMESDLTWKSKFATGPLLRRQGVTTAVYMPLTTGKEVFGTLMVGSFRPNAYKNRELKLMKYAATHLAPAAEEALTRVLVAAGVGEGARPMIVEEET